MAGGAQAVGETGGELLAPAAHRLLGDDDTTLSQDQLNIPQAEAEHMVQLDSVDLMSVSCPEGGDPSRHVSMIEGHAGWYGVEP